MEDLLKQQDELQKEAEQLLEDLRLLDLLSKYGKPIIVGSFTAKLLTWRDLDIHVIVEGKQTLNNLFSAAEELISKENVRKLELQDNRGKRVNAHMPDGLYMAIRYGMKGLGQWKIDIWFENTPEEEVTKYLNWLMSNLNEETKAAILEIKNQVANNPKYRVTIFSKDIYDSVINSGARNLNDFEKFLNQSNRSLN